MDHELAVMEFLTANGTTFICPQYPVGGGWSCPDFVAIRPAKKECLVVEVSTGWDLSGLAKKVQNREHQWLNLLRAHLAKTGVCDKDWSFNVLVFIRSERIEWFRNRIGQSSDVHIFEIEQTLTPWVWPAKVRSPDFIFQGK